MRAETTRLAELYASTRAAKRLTEGGHAWPIDHIAYPNCGHAVSLPYTPTLTEVPRAFAGRTLVFGGGASTTLDAVQRLAPSGRAAEVGQERRHIRRFPEG